MGLAGNLEMVFGKALPQQLNDLETTKLMKICHYVNTIFWHFRKKCIRSGWVAGLMEGLTLHNGCPGHYGWWWYELVKICMFFHLQFKSCPKLLTHVCMQFGSLKQDSQGENRPIPSMHTSVCCQSVLFSTITLLIVFRGEKIKLRKLNRQRRRKKDQISLLLPLQWHIRCSCLHFLFVYMSCDMWELWLHLKTWNRTQEAGLACHLGNFAE